MFLLKRASSPSGCGHDGTIALWTARSDVTTGLWISAVAYTGGNKRAVYPKKDIDLIAAQACPERSRRIPLDIWYIVPVEVCTPDPMLRFYVR